MSCKSSDSDSDFDDDEDPDKILIPGGGKDLASLSNVSSQKVLQGSETLRLKKTISLEEKISSTSSLPTFAIGNLNLKQNAMGNYNPIQNTLGNFNPMQNSLGNFNPMQLNQQFDLKVITEEEEDLEEDEQMGIAETYEDYMPTKLKLGKKHPDPVVETASLSSVEPVDVWYKLSIPTKTIESGFLSALQLESITYASQQHEQILPNGNRAGFLVGDGAGVGKGRTIAGIIFENYLKGRKRSIWVSVSNDLKYDAERDLKDIGASKIHVHLLSKFKYEKISAPVNGEIKKGVIFSTYSALIGESSQSEGKIKSRIQQLLQWCGEDFDGLIVFDECHRAKNLHPTGSSKPTKTGLTVLELQQKLPKARIIYASATGASEPKNMAYMIRLGIWGPGTPFSNFNDFILAVEKRGVGVMEIVAMDMKLRGMYIARQLSFHGVLFKSEEVPLTKDFVVIYDRSVKLWVEAMRKFQESSILINAEDRMKKSMWSQFWASHQRFFKYLCIAAKVKYAINLAHEAVKCGKCVVIGLQSTGEARTLEQLERDEGELYDFVSTAKGVFRSLVEKHFPAPDRERIQRILGIDLSSIGKRQEKKTEKATNHSLLKRKTYQSEIEKSFKKARSEINQEEELPKGNINNFFDLKEEDEEEDELEEESDLEKSDSSSDDNPFGSDSDSDHDPWDRKRKKDLNTQKKSAKKDSTSKSNVNTSQVNQLQNKNTSQVNLLQNKNTSQVNLLQNKNTSLNHGNLLLEKNILLNRNKQTGVSSGVKVENLGIKIPKSEPPDTKMGVDRAYHLKEELLAKIEELGKDLPPNTLDQLIDELGGPENVAEMTGRKGRVIQMEDGSIQYESRSEIDIPLETLNLKEKERFMNGEKLVAIISEAASSGISLQSDRRMRNQKRRVHITLELPWSADRAIQQFGRTHRSNQVNAPEYVFLISDLAGERRFASTVAKRLESLGALTHGDRRATKTRDLSQYNIDNKYGQTALELVMKIIMKYELPLVPPPSDYAGNFFKDAAEALLGVGLIHHNESTPDNLFLDKDYNNISKFLNRLLGVPVNLQNHLFKYFTDTLNAIIEKAKKNGRYDMGILDLGTSGKIVRRVQLNRYFRRHATGIAPTELHIVHVEGGMSWSEAKDHWEELTGKLEGFYLSLQARNGRRTILLAEAVKNTDQQNSDTENNQLYLIHRPNTGLQLRQESLTELKEKYKKISLDEAEYHWTKQYEASANVCSHAYWRGSCKNIKLGRDCEVGLRRRYYNVLAGSVLSIWSRIEMVMTTCCGHNSKMQVVRLRTDDSQKLIGILIPKICLAPIQEALSSDAEKVERKSFEPYKI